MPIFHAIVLGLVQGFSEFLPISSSGHLLIVPWLFGWNDFASPSVEKAFDVALHIGTLIAGVAYFRKEIAVYIREGAGVVLHRDRPPSREGRIGWLLLLSTLPAAVVGALFEKTIDEKLGTPTLIALSFIFFGLLLFVADKQRGTRTLDHYGVRDAVAIGAAQILSLNPGTSRSGITITEGRFRHFERDTAARVSFLMSIPITAGAVVYKMAKLVGDGIPDGLLVPMIVGIVTSGISGWIAVWGTLKYVRAHSFTPFVIYRVTLGVAILIIVATNWR